MGIVFEAHHIRLGQRVAIKVLGSELREFPELVQRFEREALAAGSLKSRHAVRVFDIDTIDDGTPFIVMELLAGRDLSRIVETDGPQPVARAVRWVIEACDAIAEAHRLGIIHRDLKPSNLFLARIEGREIVKVLDFGIAKRVSTGGEAAITQAVMPLGTPQYMSPEQVRSARDVDVRTDVWSLGVTLYELVTGQTPFEQCTASACIASIAADPVPDPRLVRPDLSGEFAAVLLRALEKSAANRYQSIEELVAAILPFALDPSFDGEEISSAVHRAASILPLANAPAAHTTLDAAAPERTVPPAISRAPSPPKRRVRSSLVMASAAVAGLAALVLTPHWPRSTELARASAVHVSPPVVDPIEVAPAIEVLSPPEAPAPVVAAIAIEAAKPAKLVKEKKGAPSPSVHGGLTSPGF